MFSDKKNRGKSSSLVTVQYYKPGHAITVKRAAHLLQNRQYHQLMNHLRDLSLLDVSDYESCYQTLVQHFVEYVQLLPATLKGGLSGLLSESLFYAYYNLKALVEEKKEEADSLLRYTVFSAGLLRRSAFIVERFKVIITNEEGLYLDEWNAFDGSLCDQGAQYYKIFPMGPLLTANHQILTGMIVKLLMPKIGFDWIASDLELFHEWLSTLEVETYTDGRVGRALSYIRREDALVRQSPEISADLIETPYSTHGEAFYAWLRRGLQDGSIKVNTADAFIHRVNNGLFVEYPGLIRDFVSKIYVVPVNFNIVFEQFGNLFGLVRLGGEDYRNRQFFSDYPEITPLHSSNKGTGLLSRPASAIRQGMLIQNVSLLYPEGNLPTVTRHLRSAERQNSTANTPSRMRAPENLEVTKTNPNKRLDPSTGRQS